MITIGELHDMADEAGLRGDARVAELLADEARDRTATAAVRTHDERGRRWWPTAQAVPFGVTFQATSPLCEVVWRREVGGCRALPPASDRVYAVGLVDQTWLTDGAGFVEIDPNQIVRQPV
ncbi:hypothetical protein [Nocardia wallacei]|uniref:hypothetical protein n=1 Tax=Nocardia wallacei TaxID=480035 RepID=UPI0024574490|nr:hypothetical protein [Nocardia wallacei]